MRPSDLKVIYALIGKRLGWTALLRETKISSGMLSLCLRALIEQGSVLSEEADAKGSILIPQTVYRLNPEATCPICDRCGKWKICSTVFSGFSGLCHGILIIHSGVRAGIAAAFHLAGQFSLARSVTA